METLRIGGRRYSDPDIISLCRQSGELIDPRSTIVNMARALTEKAYGFSGLPSDPLERLKIIASLSRMKIQPMDMDQVRKRKERCGALSDCQRWLDCSLQPESSQVTNHLHDWTRDRPHLLPQQHQRCPVQNHHESRFTRSERT